MNARTHWSFIDKSTGTFTGAQVFGSLDTALSCSDHLLPVIGLWDPQDWVYDLDAQAIRPHPVRTSEQTDPVAASVAAMESIRAMEAGLQRSQREVILALLNGTPPPTGAVAALTQADFEIGQLRSSLPVV